MNKTILFLADGMADEPLVELGGKTPLEYAKTPNMDKIADDGASGTFLSLPGECPTSSDAANLSVLGYDLDNNYPGRGPIEAVSKDIPLGDEDIAWRCNLVEIRNGVLNDYSAGHIKNDIAEFLINELDRRLGSGKVRFHHGVSYRNLMILKGAEFSEKINFAKPDSSQGEEVAKLLLSPADNSAESRHTSEFVNKLMSDSAKILSSLPDNRTNGGRANAIWPWSPGKKPKLQAFSEKYSGVRAAVISAVDVILGIAKSTGMDVITVPGATGFIDTNYEGKAQAAIEAIENHDFVYLHVEAIDECSHIGKLDIKIKAIEDFDSRIVGPVIRALENKKITFAVLPDHPVPIKLRKHTRTPVPVAICGPDIVPDKIQSYSEILAPKGALGAMKGDELMRKILGL